MPNRIIREGWLESDRIDALDAPAERFFLRLCLRADDFGRFHGNPILIKSSLFPLKDDVRSADIPRWIAACEKAGLIRCYEVASKRYIEIPRFDQRLRAEKSKFPSVEDGCLSDVSHVSDSHVASSEAESKTSTEAIPPYGSPEFLKAWKNWVEYRKERKKPLGPRSISEAFKSFSEWGELASIKSIQESIRNGWQGLFEPKQNGSNSVPIPKPPEPPQLEPWRSNAFQIVQECKVGLELAKRYEYRLKPLFRSIPAQHRDSIQGEVTPDIWEWLVE